MRGLLEPFSVRDGSFSPSEERTMISKIRLWAIGGLVSSMFTALLVAGCSTEPSGPSDDTQAGSTGGSATGDGTSGGTDEQSTLPVPKGRNGHVSFRLVDAPAEVKSIFVTVSRLDAELADGWKTLVEREETIDLLTLRDGAFLDLGSAELPPGRVGQLRLHLAEGSDARVTTTDGVDHPLAIPSAARSGIKLVGGFDVPECASGQVTIDFDGEKSLQLNTPGEQGANGKGKDAGDAERDWTLRPVVRIKAVVLEGQCPDADGGDAADAGASDAADPCAAVACSDAEICDNGVCRPAAD
jgi:hypothetical protein